MPVLVVQKAIARSVALTLEHPCSRRWRTATASCSTCLLTGAASLAAGFTHVRCALAEAGPSMLIRPDGCIAWVGDAGDVEGFVDALERWFVPAAAA